MLRNIFIINKIKIDFLFQSGSKSNLPNFFDSKFKILLNSFDYEYFINKNLKKNIYKKKYAVFIDVNLTNHPDSFLLNYKNIDKEQYFTNLFLFFEYLKINFNLEVKIAAHPSSDKNDFNSLISSNYKIYFNKTSYLIKNSNLVLTHHSTALSFAILFNKPVLFLYDDNIKTSFKKTIYRSIVGQAFTLKSPLINLSKPYELNNIYKKDILLYKEFISNYLCGPNKNKRNIQTICDYLKL